MNSTILVLGIENSHEPCTRPSSTDRRGDDQTRAIGQQGDHDRHALGCNPVTLVHEQHEETLALTTQVLKVLALSSRVGGHLVVGPCGIGADDDKLLHALLHVDKVELVRGLEEFQEAPSLSEPRARLTTGNVEGGRVAIRLGNQNGRTAKALDRRLAGAAGEDDGDGLEDFVDAKVLLQVLDIVDQLRPKDALDHGHTDRIEQLDLHVAEAHSAPGELMVQGAFEALHAPSTLRVQGSILGQVLVLVTLVRWSLDSHVLEASRLGGDGCTQQGAPFRVHCDHLNQGGIRQLLPGRARVI